MGVVQQFNALVWSWAEMFRALRRRAALGPFLIYAGIQTVVLLMLLGFTLPPLRLFVPALMRWRFGEQALHYPNNLLALRSALGQVDLVLSVFLGALVTASAVHLFTSFYIKQKARLSEGLAVGRSKYVPALAVAIIVAVLSQLVVRVPMSVWGGLADSSPMRFRMLRLLLIGVVIAVQAIFLYGIAAVVVDGKRIGAALSSTVALAFRQPVTTLLLVAVPAALELLPAWLMRNSPLIIYRFSPEFLVVGMFLWIVVILFINYVTVGAATRFYLHATANEGPSSEPGEGE
ncbi:MAG: hypothetical protein ABIK85_02920 [Candidatus Eisenbacteria bacterium]